MSHDTTNRPRMAATYSPGTIRARLRHSDSTSPQWAALVGLRPGLPVRIIVNRDLVLRPYQPLFFNKGTSR